MGHTFTPDQAQIKQPNQTRIERAQKITFLLLQNPCHKNHGLLGCRLKTIGLTRSRASSHVNRTSVS
jgi:hypothetical protein